MPKLLFVYAVDGGLLNTAKDVIHKIVSPSTYPCSLCALTYRTVREQPEWTTFIRSLTIEVQFLHRDELRKQYPRASHPLPAVLLDDRDLEILVAAPEIDACADVGALVRLVKERLQARLPRQAG